MEIASKYSRLAEIVANGKTLVTAEDIIRLVFNTAMGESMCTYFHYGNYRERWSALVNLKWSIQCQLHSEGTSGNVINTVADFLKCHIFSETFDVEKRRAQTLFIFLNKIKSGTPITKLSNVVFMGTNSPKFVKVWGSCAPRTISLKNLVAPSLGGFGPI